MSACGLTTPVLPGVAPGSGPGHLGLFGYDPVKYLIGRGVLEALGIGVPVAPGEVAARGNFCTVDGDGVIVDRRAGRIATEESMPLVEMLDTIDVPGVQASVYPVKDYRFVLKLTGEGLSEQVTETDPQRVGASPLDAAAMTPEAEATAAAVNHFIREARSMLAEQPKANMLTLRGFSLLPHLPSMGDRYLLEPAAIAAYPMYRGLASLLGMKVIPTGGTFADEVVTLREHWDEHDFFYLHYKPADAAGEDGDFDAKVEALEELDRFIPEVLGMGRTSSWWRATTRRLRSWPRTRGTPCLSCCTPSGRWARGSTPSASEPSAWGRWDASRRSTSCCRRWPTRTSW